MGQYSAVNGEEELDRAAEDDDAISGSTPRIVLGDGLGAGDHIGDHPPAIHRRKAAGKRHPTSRIAGRGRTDGTRGCTSLYNPEPGATAGTRTSDPGATIRGWPGATIAATSRGLRHGRIWASATRLPGREHRYRQAR